VQQHQRRTLSGPSVGDPEPSDLDVVHGVLHRPRASTPAAHGAVWPWSGWAAPGSGFVDKYPRATRRAKARPDAEPPTHHASRHQPDKLTERRSPGSGGLDPARRLLSGSLHGVSIQQP
jgi:hypothetical protein